MKNVTNSVAGPSLSWLGVLAGILLISLAGCVVGSGSGGSTATTYEALSPVSARADLLNQLNAQGARGYFFLGSNGYGSSVTRITEFVNLYARVSNVSYNYEILDAPVNSGQLLAQMNAQGERGFQLYGPTTSGFIYMKESGSSKKYLYDLSMATDTVAGFLNQANAKGADAFYSIGSYVISATSTAYNIYAKESGSNARYEYLAQPAFDPSTPEVLEAQVNALGLLGYKFRGEVIFPGEPLNSQRSRHLYIKDVNQSSVFEWKALASHTSSASFISQANAEEASNYRYWSNMAFFPNGRSNPLSLTVRVLYFKATSCSGVLCRQDGPL